MRYSFAQRKHEYKRKHLSKYDVEASMDCLHAASKEFWEGKQNKQVLNKIQGEHNIRIQKREKGRREEQR